MKKIKMNSSSNHEENKQDAGISSNMGIGHIIKKNLDALNWTQEDLAGVLDITQKTVNLLINNKQPVTFDTARLLSRVFGSSAKYWLDLDHDYRLQRGEVSDKERETEIKAQIRKFMPLLEMRKKGWLDFDSSSKSQTLAFMNFWQQPNLSFSPYTENAVKFLARQGAKNAEFTKFYQTTWLRKAGIEAEKIKISAYKIDELKKIVGNIPEYTLKPDGIEFFLHDLHHAGVIFMVISHLPRTYLDGASFFFNKNPAVVYTGRYNRLDNFWWTITHELAHVILHLQNSGDSFLDNLDEEPVDKKEIEADVKTGQLLKVTEVLALAENYQNYFTRERLEELAARCGLHAAVVLGILQYNKIIQYRTLNRLKTTILDLIPEKYIKG